MITSSMTPKEILHEFWKDYNGTIRYRLFGWINGHSGKIKKLQGKSENWVNLKETRVVKVNGNTYRCRVKAKILKGGTCGFNATTYVTTYDSEGRKLVYLLPTEDNSNALIVFESHFFSRLFSLCPTEEVKFEDRVDSFIDGVSFSLKYRADWENLSPNFSVELKPGIYGIGTCDIDKFTFKVTTCVTLEILDEWKDELGLETSDPLSIYNAHKEKIKEPVVIQIPEEKSQKELEIEQAWKEYYGR